MCVGSNRPFLLSQSRLVALERDLYARVFHLFIILLLSHRLLRCLHDEVILALGQLIGLAAVSERLHREAEARQ